MPRVRTFEKTMTDSKEGRNTYIRVEVDEITKDVTVFTIDKTTRTSVTWAMEEAHEIWDMLSHALD